MFKNLLFIFLALCLFSEQATAAESFSWPDTWTDCKIDSDCTISRSVCGNPAGVNKRYEDAADGFLKRNAPRVNCSETAPIASLETLKPVCSFTKKQCYKRKWLGLVKVPDPNGICGVSEIKKCSIKRD